MTSYVVYGLSLAKVEGYEIDQDIIDSGVNWIKDNYDEEENLNTKAYMAFAATIAGGETERTARAG